jgi:hypothetical protein
MFVVLGQLALATPVAGQERAPLLSAAQQKSAGVLSSQLRLESRLDPPLPRGVKILLFAVGGLAVGATTAAIIANHNRRPCEDGCWFGPVYERIFIGAGGLVGALIGGGIGATIFRPEPASGRER